MTTTHQPAASSPPGPPVPPGGDAAGTTPLARLWRSPVFWSWGMSGLRLGFGLFLLPLIVRMPRNDQGFYQILMALLTAVPILDMGLSTAVERGVSYAMGGARDLQAFGVHDQTTHAAPNVSLLWKIIGAARAYYALLALAAFAGLGLIGSLIVARSAGDTTSAQTAWLAWGIALVNAGLELYSGWWNVVLRGMNRVLESARIVFFCHGLKLILACLLLLNGGGLISVFAAGLVSSFLIRTLSRRTCLRHLPAPTEVPPTREEIRSLLRRLWPNSWRAGMQLMSASFAAICYQAICRESFGLGANAQYGLSINVATLASAVAAVWVNVKWPVVGQLRARQDFTGLLHLLRPRFWYQAGTFTLLALGAAVLGPFLLEWVGAKTQLLPRPWFPLLMVAVFLDLQVAFWTSLLATENRIPSAWPLTLTHLTSVTLVFTLCRVFTPDWWMFVVTPFSVNLLFNYWYWPMEGARNLRTSWRRFAFSRAA